MKIKDNTSTLKADFLGIPNLTKKLSDKTLVQLEKEGVIVFPELIKDSKDLSKDQIVLQSFNNNYLTSNVMGFVGMGEERLVITSRFASKDNDFFLNYMLETVLGLPNIIDMSVDSNSEDRLFQFLIFLFPYYLKQAVRKGLFKTYICRQYNDSNVKGVIDIARHISKNTPFVGKIAYSQREYSYDNYLTELVRHTIEFIKKKRHGDNQYGNRILSAANEEVKLIVDATQNYEFFDRRKVVAENSRNIIRHAYYREYRALQNLCLMILKNQEHNIGSGSRQIYGILFDGAWLWEEYINKVINSKKKPDKSTDNSVLFYHPMNKENRGAQYLFSEHKGLIYPDFISICQQPRVIADAKYKPYDNIYGKDYLQLLAYMFRFDAKTGLYLYPKSENESDTELFLNRGTSYDSVEKREDISVIKLGLKIPEADNYSVFKKQFEEREKQFIQTIKHKLDYIDFKYVK